MIYYDVLWFTMMYYDSLQTATDAPLCLRETVTIQPVMVHYDVL